MKNGIYLLIIGLLPFLFYRGCSGKADFDPSVKKPALKPTVQKKDKNGTVYTEIKGTLFTEEQMKHITDSMSKALGKGKVQQIIETVTVIDTEYEVKKFYIDSATGNIYAKDYPYPTKYDGGKLNRFYADEPGQMEVYVPRDNFYEQLKKNIMEASEKGIDNMINNRI
jgi:hypothetical protein